MHKRASRSAAYAEAVRARIRAGGIANRLEKHVLGQVEMTSTQVQAALGLLKKVVPDQHYTEMVGKDGTELIPRKVEVSLVRAGT